MNKPMVLIEWIDCSIIDEQVSEQELIDDLSCLDIIKTSGFLVYEDENKVVVSRDYCNKNWRRY